MVPDQAFPVAAPSPTPSPGLTKNLERAAHYLDRLRGTTIRHLIGGRLDEGSGRTFDNLDPVDNSVLCRVAAGDARDIDRAARAATDAFPAWRAVSGERRREILHAVVDGIEIVERATAALIQPSTDEMPDRRAS